MIIIVIVIVYWDFRFKIDRINFLKYLNIKKMVKCKEKNLEKFRVENIVIN